MAETNLERQLEKRAQAQRIMSDMGIPVWITWVEDNGAENATLPLIGAPDGATNRAYILTPDRAVAICGHIEASKQAGNGFEVIEAPTRDILTPLIQHLDDIVRGDKKKGSYKIAPIALNFSHKYGPLDTLGYGNTLKITNALRASSYLQERYGIMTDTLPFDNFFVPADLIIASAASAKLDYEVELLKEAAQITNDVLEAVFKVMKPGMTEKEVAAVTKGIIADLMKTDKRIGYSWKESLNPIVLTGDRIAGSPHEAPSDKVIERGSTVYIDLGVSVSGYGGDLQHFGYVLKEGETQAPEHVQKLYGLVVASINAGMAAAVPRTIGWHVDKASRDVIISAGYPPYKHGTGHQLGAGNDHAPGAVFDSRYADYTNNCESEGMGIELGEKPRGKEEAHLAIQRGYVMTIEPRVQIANGASIEVDCIITEKGAMPLVPMQEHIHLIN